MTTTPPNAIIIGASSGIGATLAIDLSMSGYSVGLAARRGDLLKTVASSLKTPTFTKVIDLVKIEAAMNHLRELIEEMGGVDLFVISSGIGHENPSFEWTPEAETIAVNVIGFAGMVNVAIQHLTTRGQGHLVGISSVSSIRGNGGAPAYGASKAFVSNYLQAVRHRIAKQGLPICVTEIQAGFVDTAMAKGDGLFWVAPVQSASRQILQAIQRKKSHAYVTKRWRLIAWLLQLLPDWLYWRF